MIKSLMNKNYDDDDTDAAAADDDDDDDDVFTTETMFFCEIINIIHADVSMACPL